jgi:hypothetical protein
VRITLLIGSSSHNYWKTFTLNDLSSSSSFSISTTEGFEDVMASYAMIGFLLMSMENKRIIKTTNLILAFERGLMFLF